MKNVTPELLDFAMETKFEDLPETVVQDAKRIILDSVAVALAGLSIDKGKLAVKLARRLGGPPEASILGTGHKVSTANAAFANGELIHAMEYCSTTHPAIHVAPFVVPAPLAVAEYLGSSGKELILAIALAHEIPTRIAWGMERWRKYVAEGPGAGTFTRPEVMGYGMNIFGGTIATGRLLGLDRESMAHAVGIAGFMAPVPTHGKWIRTRKGGMAKFAIAGWMSQAEVTAAFLAEMGYTGDQTVLDGECGFWRFYGSATWNPEEVTRKLGEEWRFASALRFKEYPSGGVIHGALACFSEVINKHRLRPEEIDEVIIDVDALSEMERFQDKEIDTEIDAQFNTAYEIAALAHRIPYDRWQNMDSIQNPQIKAFMQKVTSHTCPEFVKGSVRMLPKSARVEVKARGESFVQEGVYYKTRLYPSDSYPEESQQPDEELISKFRFNAARILTTRQVDKASQAILSLENIENITEIMQLVTT